MYEAPVGADPYLQDTDFSTRFRLLSGFAARVCTGYYGKGNQVKNCKVDSVLTVIGQTILPASDANPTKVMGSECLLPRLQVMLDGYRKVDLPTQKKLPVQANIPELLVETAHQAGTPQHQKATVDLTLLALFYYLLCIGEYTVKGSRNNTKQIMQ